MNKTQKKSDYKMILLKIKISYDSAFHLVKFSIVK